MKSKKLRIGIFILFCVLLILLMIACNNKQNIDNNDNTDNGDGGNTQIYSYTARVFDVDYSLKDGTKILLDNQIVGVTNSDGILIFNTKESNWDKVANGISIQEQNIVVHQNSLYINNEYSTIFDIYVVTEQQILDEFLFVMGKIVTHKDGESVEPDVTLQVNNNPVYNTNDEGRNYSVFMSYNSILNCQKEGYEFVDISGIPSNDYLITKDWAINASSTQTVIVNGKAVQIKEIGGVTFRAKSIYI